MVGDGEFDGTVLQSLLQEFHWQYVCRTAPNLVMTVDGRDYHIGALAPTWGKRLAVRSASMTAAHYGPVNILAIWEAAYEDAIYLVTNMRELEVAVAAYRKRAHIETFFSDQKRRGFHLHKSHLSDPARLTRLLIASCLAYLWLVYLGICAIRDGWLKQVHRQDRCDLSLFRLGLRLLARCLKDHHAIPAGLLVPAVVPGTPMRTFANRAA